MGNVHQRYMGNVHQRYMGNVHQRYIVASGFLLKSPAQRRPGLRLREGAALPERRRLHRAAGPWPVRGTPLRR